METSGNIARCLLYSLVEPSGRSNHYRVDQNLAPCTSRAPDTQHASPDMDLFCEAVVRFALR